MLITESNYLKFNLNGASSMLRIGTRIILLSGITKMWNASCKKIRIIAISSKLCELVESLQSKIRNLRYAVPSKINRI